jgi:hypothetical protein
MGLPAGAGNEGRLCSPRRAPERLDGAAYPSDLGVVGPPSVECTRWDTGWIVTGSRHPKVQKRIVGVAEESTRDFCTPASPP